MSFFQKRITLQQLLFVAFFRLMMGIAKNKEEIRKKLNITDAEWSELRTIFYSFKEESIRKHLRMKYDLEWQAKEPV